MFLSHPEIIRKVVCVHGSKEVVEHVGFVIIKKRRPWGESRCLFKGYVHGGEKGVYNRVKEGRVQNDARGNSHPKGAAGGDLRPVRTSVPCPFIVRILVQYIEEFVCRSVGQEKGCHSDAKSSADQGDTVMPWTQVQTVCDQGDSEGLTPQKRDAGRGGGV